MKESMKRFAGMLGLCAILAACALLPAGLAWGRDLKQLGAVRTVQMEPVAMGSEEEYSFLQRLRLASSENQAYGNVQSMNFETGVNYDETNAMENVKTQLDHLYTLGLSPVRGADVQDFLIESVEFGADIQNPACSLMVWCIRVFYEGSFLYVRMDDDTGLLLSLEMDGEEAAQWAKNLELTAYARAWAEYLGLKLEDGYDTLNRKDTGAGDWNGAEEDGILYEDYLDMIGQDVIYDKKEEVIVRTLRMRLSDGQDSIVYSLYAGEPGFGIAP